MATPGNEILIAGQYTVTYNSVACGMMEGDAGSPTIEQTVHSEPVNNTSTYGKSRIEDFYLGADWFASFTCLEFRTGSISCFWPFGALGLMGVISRAMSGLAAALVLTAVTGTPAQVAGSFNSVTAPLAILAPGFNSRLLFGPTLRKVPIRQVLYPSTINSNVGWISTT